MAKQTFNLLTLWKYFTLALLITSTYGISNPSELKTFVSREIFNVFCNGYQESNYIEIINDRKIYSSGITWVNIKNCPTPNLPFAKLKGLNFKTLQIINLTDGLNLRPEHLMNLSYIQELKIWNTSIETLPENLFQDLSNLTHLKLHIKQLHTLPTKIFKPLTSLTDLYIGFYNLTSLDVNIFESLKNLQKLSIKRIPLTYLPTSIFKPLENLRTLKILETGISSLPDNIFDDLTQLEELSIEDNVHLTCLSENLFRNTKKLNRVNIFGSKLSNLPVKLFNDLPSVWLLDLHNNQLTDFSENHLKGMSRLNTVFLNYNNLTTNSKQLMLKYGEKRNITIEVYDIIL